MHIDRDQTGQLWTEYRSSGAPQVRGQKEQTAPPGTGAGVPTSVSTERLVGAVKKRAALRRRRRRASARLTAGGIGQGWFCGDGGRMTQEGWSREWLSESQAWWKGPRGMDANKMGPWRQGVLFPWEWEWSWGCHPLLIDTVLSYKRRTGCWRGSLQQSREMLGRLQHSSIHPPIRSHT